MPDTSEQISNRVAMWRDLILNPDDEPGGENAPNPEDLLHDLQADVTELARRDERARIVWWLRTGLSGPAGVNLHPREALQISELAQTIEQHPERFAEAPTGRS